MDTDIKFGDCPFGYRQTKNGTVQISYKNKVVTTLKGKDADKFTFKISSADQQSQQMQMAKVTGHFKHGNEKVSKQKRGL
ncbi:MAG: hypothetical protein HOE54_07180 [Gammaproteobacteria bacterium]|jgi:hypothetical protein|nr:hypothetical protein [Gammaproteobacteria bacterium]MBT7370859.1 hypothetical protein [Gammaproteobacteria bacterium]